MLSNVPVVNPGAIAIVGDPASYVAKLEIRCSHLVDDVIQIWGCQAFRKHTGIRSLGDIIFHSKIEFMFLMEGTGVDDEVDESIGYQSVGMPSYLPYPFSRSIVEAYILGIMIPTTTPTPKHVRNHSV